jgi:putative ABC transport system permease protein
VVAVISLVVGIGVNSTVFSFVNAIFFKPISISNSAGLVYVFAGDQRNPYRSTSYLNYIEFRKQNDVFSGLAAYAAPPIMTTGEHTEPINSEVVSGNYFSVLDVSVDRGRPLTLEDEQISTESPPATNFCPFRTENLARKTEPNHLLRRFLP